MSIESQCPGDPSLSEFEKKKTNYFSQLAIGVKSALRLHQEQGLWQPTETSKRDWGNVSEHCLVEVARVKTLAKDLALDEEHSRKLVIAAALHDFFKKGEKAFMKQDGSIWDNTDAAGNKADQIMTEAGFDQETVELAGAVGHTSLLKTEAILQKDHMSAEDISFLIMHYVDDYTIESEWAEPASEGENDFERRITQNESGPRTDRYAQLNQEGVGRFQEGETTFQAQRRIGRVVQDKLAELLSQNLGETVDALDLPTKIDAEIKAEIEKL